MHFLNISTFTYQKTLLHPLLLLVFKIAESLQCILKEKDIEQNGKENHIEQDMWSHKNTLKKSSKYQKTHF